jgi:ribonucleotide monophosphatase NagD (HAD superfamily)
LLTSAAVLIVSWKRFEGAVAALRRLHEAGLPLALVTSTISGTPGPVLRAIRQG